MTAPNRNALWGAAVVDELAAAGVEVACVTPGSRSTPLTVAFAEHEEIAVRSHLDERSAAFFALGRGAVTGEPTALVCTSGTAAANYHPAVIEADRARVPLLALTADRPPELRDSGANQTVDQQDLYGDAVRYERTLPEPAPRERALRSLRTTVSRAVAAARGVPPGPVHLNCPFRKPLEPTPVAGDVPESLAADAPTAVHGRDGPYVQTRRGRTEPDAGTLADLSGALSAADRALLVAGPVNPALARPAALAALADAAGLPVLADPLSGLRFGDHVADRPVLGGYDAYLDERVTRTWPDPDVVVRFGRSPTSKPLRRWLARTDARQVVVDPAGRWPEAEFTATDLVVADPAAFATALADRVDRSPRTGWHDRLRAAERAHWDLVDDLRADDPDLEGAALAAVAESAPAGDAVFVSNSMPVRDLDRFGRPRERPLLAAGNRGASGIDGITSTALGVADAVDGHLTLVTGDLAYYHDTNGLLAVARCGVDATVVLINNDGGGIFHALPIEDFDPPFTEQFRTPHGLDFEPTGDLYDLDYRRADPGDPFRSVYQDAVATDGTSVIEVQTDAETSHRTREALQDRLIDRLA